MINRRKVIQSLATLPFAGSLLGAHSLSAQSKTAAVVSSLRRDFFKELGCPILVGISRKSMIYRVLDTDPKNSLNGTTSLNTISLLKGANILRVHDVKQASEVVKLVDFLSLNS